MFILASIGILALLILVHELGHFSAARLQGIHVSGFSIGFGPAIWSYQGKETEYALRLLPLGGYVGFPDEDEECPYPSNDPDLLKNRPVLDRLVVMSAGVLANLVFAYLVLITMFGTLGIPTAGAYQPGILLPQVTPSGPAYQAGLRSGDLIFTANGTDYSTIATEEAAKTAVEGFQTLVRASANQPIQLRIRRPTQEQPLEISVTPVVRAEGEKPVIGVNLAPHQQTLFRRVSGLGELFSESGTAYQRVVMLNLQGFKQLIQNFQSTASQVSGPVGIVKMGADLAQSDGASLFNFAALISINLAILNILPLPALDGGHIAFLLIEAIRGKRVPKKIEERVMQSGLVFLLGLGVVLIFKDTIALVAGAG